MPKNFAKPFQLWTYADYGYTPTEFDSLKEALEAVKYTDDWYITKKVEYTINETL